MRNADPFKAMSARLEELQTAREQLAYVAFSMLEERQGDFAKMLILGLGDRTRAVWWMCMRHRNLEGRTAYQVMVDGEQDRLWEVVENLCGIPEL